MRTWRRKAHLFGHEVHCTATGRNRGQYGMLYFGVLPADHIVSMKRIPYESMTISHKCTRHSENDDHAHTRCIMPSSTFCTKPVADVAVHLYTDLRQQENRNCFSCCCAPRVKLYLCADLARRPSRAIPTHPIQVIILAFFPARASKPHETKMLWERRFSLQFSGSAQANSANHQPGSLAIVCVRRAVKCRGSVCLLCREPRDQRCYSCLKLNQVHGG